LKAWSVGICQQTFPMYPTHRGCTEYYFQKNSSPPLPRTPKTHIFANTRQGLGPDVTWVCLKSGLRPQRKKGRKDYGT